jgi:hypothetical protein
MVFRKPLHGQPIARCHGVSVPCVYLMADSWCAAARCHRAIDERARGHNQKLAEQEGTE